MQLLEHKPIDTDNAELIGAGIANRDTWKLKIYDDGFGDLFVYGHEFGPTMVIRAQSWESAYEIAIDESAPIPFDEVYEAYGFDTAEEFENCDNDDLELAEGYQYQSNSIGTGIVNVGHYEWMTTIEEFNQPRDDGKVFPVWIIES